MRHAEPSLEGKRDAPYKLKLVVAAALSCLAWLSWGFVERPATAFAATFDQTVKMSAVVGFNGFFGKNQWVPIRLRLDNPGRALSAELVVEVNYSLDNGRLAQGTLRWPVQLPAKGTTYKEIAVPGDVIDSASVSCTVEGQAVGAVRLAGNALGNTSLVAVLSKEAQSAQFLTGSTGPTGAPVLPISVNPENLPDAPNLLDDLTALFASPANLGQLSPKQQAAVLQWVKLGGQLVITGTSGEPSSWTPYLPIQPGPKRSISGDGLNQLFDSPVPPPPNLVTYGHGLRAGGQLWAGTAALPLVGAMQVGRGTVIQTSFFPSQAALLGWSSNAVFWAQVLKDGNAGPSSALPSLLDKSSVLTLATASDSLTPLRIPSLRFWGLIFALYVVVLGPGVFFILRRKKRETLGWLILPGLSILTTIGIYTFGAAQRPMGTLTEGVGVMDLVGDGSGEVYGIRAFMSPYVSNAFLSVNQSMLMLPLAEQNVRLLGNANVVTGQQTQATFEDIGRWGIRYVYAAGAVNNLGEFQTELEQFGMVHDSFRGLISNNTPYPMHDVALYWNHQMYQLGDMSPSSTVSLTPQTVSKVVPTNWLSGYSSYNRDITHGIGRPLGSLANQLGFMNSDIRSNQAILIATTDVSNPGLPKLLTDQKIASSQGLVLVRQIVDVTQYPPEVNAP